MKPKILSALGIFLLSSSLFATHISGGQLYYEVLDTSGTCQITLELYRDCFLGQAEFDNFINLFVFESQTGNLLTGSPFSMARPSQTPVLSLQQLDSCWLNPPNICVEVGVYETTITLPPVVGGYDIAWARCCRTSAITNLDVPLAEGITFVSHIPTKPNGTLISNRAPYLDSTYVPIFCADRNLGLDLGLTDPDGDSLVYRFAAPYTGINTAGLGAVNPNFIPGGSPVVQAPNPMGPAPYQTVVFANGYSATDAFGSGLLLDPTTGYLSGRPMIAGIFTLAIDVDEYRNGQFLNTQRLDYMIHVVPCDCDEGLVDITPILPPLPTDGDTLLIPTDSVFSYQLTVNDAAEANFEGVSSEFLFGATLDLTQPNQVTVSWRPACQSYDATPFPLIVKARRSGFCPLVAGSYDTTWVKFDLGGQRPGIAAAPTPAFEVVAEGQTLTLTNQTNGNGYGVSYRWDLGDGTQVSAPSYTHTYAQSGIYTVSLTGTNGCGSQTISQTLSVTSVNTDPASLDQASLSWEMGEQMVRVSSPKTNLKGLSLLDIQGRVIRTYTGNQLQANLSLSLADLPNATYLIRVSTQQGLAYKRVAIIR